MLKKARDKNYFCPRPFLILRADKYYDDARYVKLEVGFMRG